MVKLFWVQSEGVHLPHIKYSCDGSDAVVVFLIEKYEIKNRSIYVPRRSLSTFRFPFNFCEIVHVLKLLPKDYFFDSAWCDI